MPVSPSVAGCLLRLISLYVVAECLWSGGRRATLCVSEWIHAQLQAPRKPKEPQTHMSRLFKRTGALNNRQGWKHLHAISWRSKQQECSRINCGEHCTIVNVLKPKCAELGK